MIPSTWGEFDHSQGVGFIKDTFGQFIFDLGQGHRPACIEGGVSDLMGKAQKGLDRCQCQSLCGWLPGKVLSEHLEIVQRGPSYAAYVGKESIRRPLVNVLGVLALESSQPKPDHVVIGPVFRG